MALRRSLPEPNNTYPLSPETSVQHSSFVSLCYQVVCVPQQDFCRIPRVNNGYVNSVSEEGKATASQIQLLVPFHSAQMGSIVELHCQQGFQDERVFHMSETNETTGAEAEAWEAWEA